jgi:low molecular weight phosphotyrosine protein phosphatase
MPEKVSVLFVCLGNICRSTMAEGIFQSIARKPPYKDLVDKIDSCGTGKLLEGLKRPLPAPNLR